MDRGENAKRAHIKIWELINSLMPRKQDKTESRLRALACSFILYGTVGLRIFDSFIILRSSENLCLRTPATKWEKKKRRITKSVVLYLRLLNTIPRHPFWVDEIVQPAPVTTLVNFACGLEKNPVTGSRSSSSPLEEMLNLHDSFLFRLIW